MWQKLVVGNGAWSHRGPRGRGECTLETVAPSQVQLPAPILYRKLEFWVSPLGKCFTPTEWASRSWPMVPTCL